VEKAWFISREASYAEDLRDLGFILNRTSKKNLYYIEGPRVVEFETDSWEEILALVKNLSSEVEATVEVSINLSL